MPWAAAAEGAGGPAELKDLPEPALDTLLADNDPSTQSYEEFRGHQFDHGLAWVMYPEGHGGLGVRPQLQKVVNQRLHEAGAPPMDASMFFIALAGPTILTRPYDHDHDGSLTR